MPAHDRYGPGYIESVELPGDLLRTAAAAIAAGLEDGRFSPDEIRSWGKGLGYGRQVVFPLSYLYICPESELRGDGRLLDAARTLGEGLAGEDHFEHRMLWALVESRRLLLDAGERETLRMTDEVAERSAGLIAERFEAARHVTHITSANMGTSTNHIAVMAGALLRYGQDEGRPEWVDLAREMGLKVAADQVRDGYWAETTGGPTMLYNYLTMCCMGRLFRATGEDAFGRAARRAAELHARYAYPDGCNVETVDGRCRYHATPMMWGGFVFSETPEGRGFVALKLKTLLEHLGSVEKHPHSGELLALLCEDHMLWTPGEAAPPACLRPRYTETLSVGGLVRREGPWTVTYASPPHTPRPGANFTIDRQNIFSVWHARTGLIVNGSGEDSRPEAATFRIDPSWAGEHRLQVPEIVTCDAGDSPGAAARLHAEYRGGTCRLEALFCSGTELEIRAFAGCRDQLYPVHLTVPLELRYGAALEWGDGGRVGSATLKEGESLAIAPGDLGGRLTFGDWRVEISSSGNAPASLEWPYDPHNPYSPDRKSPPGLHVGLLRIDLPPEGARLRFTVRDGGGEE